MKNATKCKNYRDNYDADFSDLKGKTLKSIEGGQGSETMIFETTEGERYRLMYYQDCCASCSVEDICGELSDLIGTPILLAEEVQSSKPDETAMAARRAEYEEMKARHGSGFWYKSFEDFYRRYESETWTFYKLSTVKGSVTIRWYGSSNGYYSETATFERLP